MLRKKISGPKKLYNFVGNKYTLYALQCYRWLQWIVTHFWKLLNKRE